MTINSAQCRAARALLDWSQMELSDASGIGQATIAHFERDTRKPYPKTKKILRAAFEAAGIIFTEKDETAGLGVRLRE